MSLSTGQVLNNRYRIVRLLGQGGFGAVYRAWDMNLNGPCALKENFDSSPEAQKQFAVEASLLFNLRHPNLPKVIDQFSIPEQGQYLVMEFIEGEDLDDLLKIENLPLPEAKVVLWIAQVCDALTYLHSRTKPIIHRDVKPANVRITPEGNAILVDFGVAKLYDPAKRTTLGARAVTPGYAPFEQYGQRPTDARSDIYALGATLYYALTGKEPPESIDRVAGAALIPPREINRAVSLPVEAAVLHALEMQPENRFPTAADFKSALLSALSAAASGVAAAEIVTTQRSSKSPVLAGAPAIPAAGRRVNRPQPKPDRPARPRKLPWLWIAAGSLFFIVLATALAVYGFFNGPGKTADPPATQAAALPVSVTSTTPAAKPSTATATLTGVVVFTPTAAPAAATVEPAEATQSIALPQLITDTSGLPMALIPAGMFLMGATTGDPNTHADELPKTGIVVATFYMDVFEVTNAAFDECVQAGKCEPPESTTWNQPDQAKFPVTNVSFQKAAAYCAWRGARLPNEAEWEKAARGRLEDQLYPWGNQAPSCDPGAINGAQYNACGQSSVPVGTFTPNGYGLYDMAGNVWEWVSSLYKPYPYNAGDGREDLSANQGSVTRGGSYFDGAPSVRPATRGVYQPSFWLVNIGFRCAKTP